LIARKRTLGERFRRHQHSRLCFRGWSKASRGEPPDARGGVIGFQVLNEFVNVLRRKQGRPWREIELPLAVVQLRFPAPASLVESGIRYSALFVPFDGFGASRSKTLLFERTTEENRPSIGYGDSSILRYLNVGGDQAAMTSPSGRRGSLPGNMSMPYLLKSSGVILIIADAFFGGRARAVAGVANSTRAASRLAGV
jgi:hypothetical protein